MMILPLFIGFEPSQVVVWDFVHQQLDLRWDARPKKPTLKRACTLPPAPEIVDASSDEEAGETAKIAGEQRKMDKNTKVPRNLYAWFQIKKTTSN